jgi:hypothetical protein
LVAVLVAEPKNEFGGGIPKRYRNERNPPRYRSGKVEITRETTALTIRLRELVVRPDQPKKKERAFALTPRLLIANCRRIGVLMRHGLLRGDSSCSTVEKS